MADIYCSYCNSLIIGERCDSCGAPIINTCKHITIIDLRKSFEISKSNENIKRGGIRL